MYVDMLVNIVCSGNRIWEAGMSVPASQGARTPYESILPPDIAC